MYGFAKNHKTNCPLRPVLSAIKTPEYALCKCLEIELKPYLKSGWIINSSFEFVEKFKKKPNQVCTPTSQWRKILIKLRK